MADLSITVGNIVPSTGAVVNSLLCGATITQGKGIYLDSVTNKVKLGNAITSLATARLIGISVSSALDGQWLSYQTGGLLAFGAILTAGHVYVLSGLADGGISDITGLASTWYTSILGYAISTTVMQLTINPTGILNV